MGPQGASSNHQYSMTDALQGRLRFVVALIIRIGFTSYLTSAMRTAIAASGAGESVPLPAVRTRAGV